MMSILTRKVIRLLLLPAFVTAVAVLVKGYVSVGDGFSAGVIAATGIVLQYIVAGRHEIEERLPILRFSPAIAFVGLLLVVILVFVPVALGDPLLTHYPGPGEKVVHLGTIEILTAVLFDVGVFLLVVGFIVTAVSFIARSAERRA